MANVPGTIWRKVVPFFGAPPQWVQVGNFAMGIQGPAGQSIQGPPGPAGVPGPPGVAGTSVSAPRGYIDGFILSNDATSPNTVLDIGAGNATDSTGTYFMTSGAFTKTTGAWAAGSSSGGLFAGTVASSTWYHVFAIHKTSDGSVDFGLDTSVTAANIPAGYNAFRRLGSVLTDGSSHLIAFHQYGDEFWWDTSVLDVNATNPGTSAVSRTLTVPTGLKVQTICTMSCFSSTLNIQGYLSSLDSVDLAASFANAIEDGAGDTTIEGLGARLRIWTNTSAQVRSRISQSDGNTTVKIRTLGWRDLRGANA